MIDSNIINIVIVKIYVHPRFWIMINVFEFNKGVRLKIHINDFALLGLNAYCRQ